MHEPSVRTSRLAIAGGLAAILVIGGGGFLLGRTTAPTPAPPPPQPIVIAPAPSPVPDTSKNLARADLIKLALQAADAFASGDPLPKSVTDAAGRSFDLLLPFGCDGPSAPESHMPMQWRYDKADGTLRISAKPMTWTAADWGLGEEVGIDAAEGFWITRPWSSSGACPAQAEAIVPRGVEPVTLPGQSLAIAQFFRGETDRDGRRNGRPFETVQRISSDTFDSSRGFQLQVSGRIETIAGGGPVRCIQPAGPEQRPICAIGVRIDTVLLKSPGSEEVLAMWTVGRSRQ